MLDLVGWSQNEISESSKKGKPSRQSIHIDDKRGIDKARTSFLIFLDYFRADLLVSLAPVATCN